MLLAERSDVEEENVRMRTHAERFSAMLDEGGEVGQAAGFSAAGDESRGEYDAVEDRAGMAGERGAEAHGDWAGDEGARLERAREQVQNLE